MASDHTSPSASTDVTGERIFDTVQSFFGFNGTISEDGDKFFCLINGVPTRYDVTPLPFGCYINVMLFENRLPASEHARFMDWVATYNERTHFVTTYVVPTDEGEIFSADSFVLTEAGLTDEELQAALGLALEATQRAALSFCQEFGIEVEGLTDAQN